MGWDGWDGWIWGGGPFGQRRPPRAPTHTTPVARARPPLSPLSLSVVEDPLQRTRPAVPPGRRVRRLGAEAGSRHGGVQGEDD